MAGHEIRIAVIDDEENILDFLGRALDRKGYRSYRFGRAEDALSKLAEIRPHLVVSDIVMPDVNGLELLQRVKEHDPEINVVLITAHASIETAISAMRGGASDYLIKPFKVEELESVVQRALSSKRFVMDTPSRARQFGERYGASGLVGQSAKMCEIQNFIARAAPTDTTVLITGESGTGKELVARAIHYNSSRKGKAFVSINCAALPESLLESELFGHEKGSFTGAIATKMGLLELAHEGTFFFDEVGELPLSLQAKLLRVLQEREFKRVGGLRDIKVDVRIVAATAKDLKTEVERGGFREDLYYRLNVLAIAMPPLRDRKEDIPLLVAHLLDRSASKLGITKRIDLSEDAMAYLRDECTWPGNIRELENLIERLLTLSDNGRVSRDEILSYHMPGEADPAGQESGDPQSDLKTGPGADGEHDLKNEIETYERRLIENVLHATGGNKFQAAKRLKISRQSLQYKLKKYNLE
jgi:DNA-binding NtrC family response regulator